MPTSFAHIAGVGIEKAGQSIDKQAVAAVTKALLDAGASYDDVDQSIASTWDEKLRIPQSCLTIFGKTRAATCEVDNTSALSLAIQSVKSGQSNCTLLVGLDTENPDDKSKALVVAVVLVSDLFMQSHPYLKDSSITIRASTFANRAYSRSQGASNDARSIKNVVQAALHQAQLETKDLQLVQAPQSTSQNVWKALGDTLSDSIQGPAGATGLVALSRLVWQLRGWAQEELSSVQNSLQATASQDGPVSILILSRSDGNKGRKWKDIEHVRDGRERLGYNPAVKEQGITHEDLQAVRAREEFTTDDLIKKLDLPLKGGDRASLARL